MQIYTPSIAAVTTLTLDQSGSDGNSCSMCDGTHPLVVYNEASLLFSEYWAPSELSRYFLLSSQKSNMLKTTYPLVFCPCWKQGLCETIQGLCWCRCVVQTSGKTMKDDPVSWNNIWLHLKADHKTLQWFVILTTGKWSCCNHVYYWGHVECIRLCGPLKSMNVHLQSPYV